MKITDIKIDGFGVWHDLSLRGLSPEISVFYGPNEAGKTTLMHFLRSVLYGVSPARRGRYLPPLDGGRPGGWLKILGDEGPLTVSRYADRGPHDIGKVTVIMPDGEEQGDRLLREALDGIDEPTYQNVFAVGLREVQELGTLSDTAVAQWLYRLTSGLDRISLYDVIHLLGNTRLRLLNSADEPSEIRTLVALSEQLRGELDELVVKGRRWSQAAVKLRELADEADRRQAEAKQLAANARRLEIAIGLKPMWSKREKVDDQLLHFQNLRPLEEGALDTLDDLNKRIEEHERQRDILKGQRHQLRDEAERLGINDLLVHNGRRLEALAEQQEWLEALQKQSAEVRDEVSHLEARLASENERLSHEWTGAGKIPPSITEEIVEQLSPQARAIEATQQLFASAKHEVEHHRSGEHAFRSQIESAMTTGDKFGLPKDLDEAGNLVALLRRRVQVEQRIDKARRHADDLRQQSHDLVEEQVVPMGLFSWLLALFVLGFVLLAAWYLMPGTAIGRYGGLIAALGMGGSIFAWLFKHFAENSASGRMEDCYEQLKVVAKQIEDGEAEQKQLDRELPMTEGSAALRLEHAEQHLEELERMLPVESKRREAHQDMTSAERRLELAEEKHAAALANWQNKLRALGLPADVLPADLATMAGQYAQIAELEQRIDNRRDDAVRLERQFNSVAKRIDTLAEETGLGLEKAAPLDQLQHLLSEYHRQTERVARREELAERAKELKVEEGRRARAAVGLGRRRDVLFQNAGVEDEHGLRQLADKLEEAEGLRKRRAAITREIAAAIGRHGTEQDFAPLLAPDSIGRLEHDWEALSTEAEQLDGHLKEALERRGAMVEQQRTIAADHSLAYKQMELDEVTEQLALAYKSWRERAVVSLMLDRIREDYEQNRQPETLQEASKHLVRLTSGKYTRIWTPIADDVLQVDTADGQTLPVEVLSRGTREQLFVSLRLALVAAYARRGIHLPMILDDVLVNFDAGRAKVAASVLAEFAKEGHQLLIFTCHEHVWRMFQQIKVDSRRLPNRFQEEEEGAGSQEPGAGEETVARIEDRGSSYRTSTLEAHSPILNPQSSILNPPPIADPLDELNQSLQEEELSEEEEPEEIPVEAESSEAEFDSADEDSEPAEEPPSPATVEVEYSWSE
jgi:uncharacterized protein YhaN